MPSANQHKRGGRTDRAIRRSGGRVKCTCMCDIVHPRPNPIFHSTADQRTMAQAEIAYQGIMHVTCRTTVPPPFVMLGHTTACVISVNHWQPTAAAAVGPWPVVPHSTLLVVLAQNKLVSFRAGKYRDKRERRGLDQSRPRNCSAGTTVFQSHRFVSSEVLMIDCEFGWHKVFQSHRHACLSFFRQSSLPGGVSNPPCLSLFLQNTRGGIGIQPTPPPPNKPHHQTNHNQSYSAPNK